MKKLVKFLFIFKTKKMKGYKIAGDYLIIGSIPEGAIHNLNRKGISNPNQAKYRTNLFQVIEIRPIKEGGECITEITNTVYTDKKISYIVGETTYEPNFDLNLNKVCAEGIHFFKTEERALQFYTQIQQNKNNFFNLRRY
jgi:hypothetical protein